MIRLRKNAQANFVIPLIIREVVPHYHRIRDGEQ